VIEAEKVKEVQEKPKVEAEVEGNTAVVNEEIQEDLNKPEFNEDIQDVSNKPEVDEDIQEDLSKPEVNKDIQEELIEPEEIDEDVLIPKDSIHGNSTLHKLSRIKLHTILTKRLQFTHIGDSPPTAPLAATPDPFKPEEDVTMTTIPSETGKIYHSLFQKGPLLPEEFKRTKQVLKEAYTRSADGIR